MNAKISICILFCLPVHPFAQNKQAPHNTEDSSRIRIARLAINSYEADFCPFVCGKHLYYLSSNNRRLAVSYEDPQNRNKLTDILSARLGDSLEFRTPRVVKELSTRYNEGPFCFNTAGTEFYFTAGDKKRSSGKLKIFKCEKTNKGWSKPQTLPFCENEYNYCHPSISRDGQTLVFSSDMKGGYGGMDIYICKLEKGQWSRPVNAGKTINSEANELFPFAGENSRIYFSVNKNGGMGGLDIYCASSEGTKLLPVPINSPGDDYGIWLDESMENGYFSSNRNAAAKDDIYYFSAWMPDFSGSKQPEVKNKFCYTFYEESLAAGSTDSLDFEWNFGDGTKSRGLRSRHCYSRPGNYTVQLNVIEKVSGTVFNSDVTYTLTIDDPPRLRIDCHDTVPAGSEVLISSHRSALKGYEIKNTYWSFGDGRYNRGSTVRHNYCKTGDYNLELMVIARNEKTNEAEKFRIEKKIIVKGNK